MNESNFYQAQAKSLTEQNIRKCMDAIQRVPREHLSVITAREVVTYLSVMLDYVHAGDVV